MRISQTIRLGGGIYGLAAAAVPASSEWAASQWKQVALDLSGYHGTAQLRFSLEVDQTVADKGWLIDDVSVR
jgi:hypothetical protein